MPPLPDLVALGEELVASGADLKVVPPDRFHLTLKFLGEVPDATVPPLQAALRGADLPPRFPLVFDDVGAFPDWRKLNVLWVGVQDPSGSFARAFAQVEQAFHRFGFEPEGRSFNPHLTMARKRTERGQERAKQVLERWRGRRFGQATIDTIRLFKSTLTSTGPVYEALEEVMLA